MDSDLYLDGRHYDRMYSAGGADGAFMLRLARERGGPILELACGTGRYLLPWAAAGFDCCGLDLARPMLDWAAVRAREAGVRMELHCGDMRAFSLGRRFGLIVLVGNSIGHLHSADDLWRVLACVQEHLAPGGAFVIDVFVPDARLLARDPGQRYPFAEYDDPDGGGRVVVTHTARYDAVTQVMHITTFARRPGDEGERTGTLSVKMWFPAELLDVVARAGFEVERFGDYDGSALGEGSLRQILVCRGGAIPTRQ